MQLGIDDIARLAAEAKSAGDQGGAPRKPTTGSIPSVKEEKGPSSLYIFSSDNIIRKFACLMIDWPYPFLSVSTIDLFFKMCVVMLP